MRILWLSPWLRPVARNIAEPLQRLGAEVMLVTADLHPESKGVRDYETVLLGRPVPTADWIRIAKAYRAARRFKPDVIVTELLRDPRWRVFGSMAPRVCILHDDKPHDETHEPHWWFRSFYPWNARADATIVFSNYVADSLRQMGATKSPIYVAPLGTDLDPSQVPEFVPAAERKNFILVGLQSPYKNHKVIFEAWRAHTRGPAWQGDELVIFGEGTISDALPPHARWARRSFRYSEVVDELASAKGSVVHTRTASQSGVQVMSMQLGVPTIVSTAGGLPEYQPAGLSVTGIDDVEGLAHAFDTLAQPAEVEWQSHAALDRFRKNFDPAIAAERLLEIFNILKAR